MAKKKKLNSLQIDGFELVPETVGVIIDSIWHNAEREELLIKFATGRDLYFRPVPQEDEIDIEIVKKKIESAQLTLQWKD